MMKAMKIVAGIIIVFILILAIAGLELWSQIGRYQAYWNRQNALPLQAGELRYVALGDSTAQGIGASSPAKGYVGLIAKELMGRTGKKVHTTNLSKSGAKLSDVLLTQLPLLQKAGIDDNTVVTIEIGANDRSAFEPLEFEQHMDTLMSKLPKQTIISDIPSFAGSRNRKRELDVQQANAIMYRLAAKHHVKLAGLYAQTKNNRWPDDFAIDGFHPSGYAYKTHWAPAFLERM
jgi:acyl-CoA thioesterase I